MKQYIALLRGINISGKNKIAMPQLKEAFEEIGFLNVTTYINSGNVCFTTTTKNLQQLQQQCEDIIKHKFHLDIPVAIIPIPYLKEVLEHAPIWWDQPSEKEIIHQVIFLIPPTTIEEVYNAIKPPKAEYEKVSYYKNTIFFSAPRETFNKASWSKIASSSVNNNVTIRNANTAKKLLALAQ